MDSPIVIPGAQTPSPTTAGRRRTGLDSNSPDFEFWMVRNPSFPQPNLLSADELFVDGVLLPLHLLPHNHAEHPDPNPEPDPENLEPSPPDSGPKISSSSAAVDSSTPSLGASKRWRDIFKKGDKEKKSAKSEQEDSKDKEKEKEKEKEKKRERKSSGGGGGTSSSAELNINIWPFSRSRSAGNACTRPKAVFGAAGPTRKVNSAPCSRSNSAGESKSRKWPSSPGRPGVHLGRSSPVWQVRRGGTRSFDPPVRNAEKTAKKDASESRVKPTGAAAGGSAGGGTAKAKVLNLNVPMCMGYRNHLSCRSDENSALGISNGDGSGGVGVGKNPGGGGGGGRGVGVGGGGNLFNLRSLFTKKVY